MQNWIITLLIMVQFDTLWFANLHNNITTANDIQKRECIVGNNLDMVTIEL